MFLGGHFIAPAGWQLMEAVGVAGSMNLTGIYPLQNLFFHKSGPWSEVTVGDRSHVGQSDTPWVLAQRCWPRRHWQENPSKWTAAPSWWKGSDVISATKWLVGLLEYSHAKRAWQQCLWLTGRVEAGARSASMPDAMLLCHRGYSTRVHELSTVVANDCGTVVWVDGGCSAICLQWSPAPLLSYLPGKHQRSLICGD